MKKVLLFALLVSACAWRFQRVEGEPPSVSSSLWQSYLCLGRELRADSCSKAFAPYFSCTATASLCETNPAGEVVTVPADAKVAFSFVHFGDAAVRERAMVYAPGVYNALSADNRWRRHSDSALAGLVAAANEIEGTQFVIHTGNAVGTGLFSELMRFIAAMDLSQRPWFNAIGPRDAAFMGDKPLESVVQVNVIAPYVPIGDAYRFMKYHSKLEAIADPSMPFVSERTDNHEPTAMIRPNASVPTSNFHGFDFACARRDWCTQMHGYYAFNVQSAEVPSLHFRVLVLNTSEAEADDGHSGSARGHLLRAQLEWLRTELAQADDARRFLVFGYHTLSRVEDAAGVELRDALVGEKRVLAYFHGGEQHTYELVKRPAGGVMPSIGAGEIQRFPQTGRLVEVLHSNGALFLRIKSFSQFNDADEKFLEVDPAPPTSGTCGPLSEGTGFCYRLSRTAGDSRAAARAIFEGDIVKTQRVSNGVLRVF